MNNVRLHYKFKTGTEMPISKAALVLWLLPRRNRKANPILRFPNGETFFSVFPYFMLLTELFLLSSVYPHVEEVQRKSLRMSRTHGSKCRTDSRLLRFRQWDDQDRTLFSSLLWLVYARFFWSWSQSSSGLRWHAQMRNMAYQAEISVPHMVKLACFLLT